MRCSKQYPFYDRYLVNWQIITNCTFLLLFLSHEYRVHTGIINPSTFPGLNDGVCSGLDIRLSSVEAILSGVEVSNPAFFYTQKSNFPVKY
jgi:hypothetical protein